MIHHAQFARKKNLEEHRSKLVPVADLMRFARDDSHGAKGVDLLLPTGVGQRHHKGLGIFTLFDQNRSKTESMFRLKNGIYLYLTHIYIISDVLLKGILDQKGFSKVGAVFWLVLMFQESYCYHACCWVLCCACSCHVMFMSCSCHVPVHVMFIMFRSCHFSM